MVFVLIIQCENVINNKHVNRHIVRFVCTKKMVQNSKPINTIGH